MTQATAASSAISAAELPSVVSDIVDQTPIHDIHTHLYAPAFDKLLLWGIDDVLTYHYLIAEAFRRFESISYDQFWAMSKEAQADAIWQALFVDSTPISEACRGVVTTLQALGLDTGKGSLAQNRQWFREQEPDAFVDRCLELSGVRTICMTNSPFDADERPVWDAGFSGDERFTSALRIDPLLLDWPTAGKMLRDWGYDVAADLSGETFEEVQRFLADWGRRMDSQFAMVSLPPDFEYPASTDCARLIDGAVLPYCREHGKPFALMPGVIRAVNPQLKLAGDGVGRSDLSALRRLCAGHPENRFAATVLARENQHELCVLARKFPNLHIFGCWWFTNTPSIVDEMTRMRLELLGFSFTPQHSDARVLDQLVYKWRHSKAVITRVLIEHYEKLAAAGWTLERSDVERDVQDLLGGSFARFASGVRD